MGRKQGRDRRIGYYPDKKRDSPTPPRRNSGGGGGYFPAQKSAPKRGMRSRGVRAALICLCLAVFCFSAAMLYSYISDYINSQNQSRMLREEYYASFTDAPSQAPEAIAPPASGEPEATPRPQAAQAVAQTATLLPEATPASKAPAISARFAALRKRNDDIVGWLTIEGVLDEAVVQRDNNYYLRRDYLGKSNATGALFMDENCILRRSPEQIVIHGHNMKTGAMFGKLMHYKSDGVSFYKNNPYISFDTIYEDMDYVVFAVSEIDIRPKDSKFFSFMSYPSFSSDSQFDEYVKRAKALSIYFCPVDVRRTDKLLTLATCVGDDDNKRLLVMARGLRQDEDMIALSKAVYSASKK